MTPSIQQESWLGESFVFFFRLLFRASLGEVHNAVVLNPLCTPFSLQIPEAVSSKCQIHLKHELNMLRWMSSALFHQCPSVLEKGASSDTKGFDSLLQRAFLDESGWEEGFWKMSPNNDEIFMDWWSPVDVVQALKLPKDAFLFIPDCDNWLRLYSQCLKHCFHSRFSFSWRKGSVKDGDLQERMNCAKNIISFARFWIVSRLSAFWVDAGSSAGTTSSFVSGRVNKVVTQQMLHPGFHCITAS